MDNDDLRVSEDRSADRNSFVRRLMVWAAVALVAFLLGLVPMWLSNRTLTQEVDKTKRDLRRSQILNTLASATINARRGEYETGRQNISTFYTDARAELDSAESTIYTQQEKPQIVTLTNTRDEIITLLSRSDPASAERLSDLYVGYKTATSGL